MRENFYHRVSCVITQLLIILILIGVKAKAGNIHAAKHPAADSCKPLPDKPCIISDTSGETGIDAQGSAAYPVVYTNLLAHPGNTLVLTDGVAAVFDNRFSASVDEYDAAKLWNFNENIAIARNNSFLAVEFRPVPMLRDTIFFRLYLKQQPYALQFVTQNFSGMDFLHAWLVDTYLNTKTAMNPNDTALYYFTPNPDTLSYRNRFMLVLSRQLIATPVPVTKILNQDDPNVTGISNVISAKTAGITVFPNPVSNGKPMLRFTAMDRGSYAIAIYNARGQKATKYTLQHGGGDFVYALLTGAVLKPGVYTINVTSQQMKRAISLKLIVNE